MEKLPDSEVQVELNGLEITVKGIQVPNDPNDPGYWEFWRKVTELTCPESTLVLEDGEV